MTQPTLFNVVEDAAAVSTLEPGASDADVLAWCQAHEGQNVRVWWVCEPHRIHEGPLQLVHVGRKRKGGPWIYGVMEPAGIAQIYDLSPGPRNQRSNVQYAHAEVA